MVHSPGRPDCIIHRAHLLHHALDRHKHKPRCIPVEQECAEAQRQNCCQNSQHVQHCLHHIIIIVISIFKDCDRIDFKILNSERSQIGVRTKRIREPEGAVYIRPEYKLQFLSEHVTSYCMSESVGRWM